MNTRLTRRHAALLGAMLLPPIALASTARAQPADGPLYDPAQLPQITGKVAQYDLAPGGRIEGLILTDGTEVHVAPHLSTELAAAVRPGDTIEAHGEHATGIALFRAESVTDQASGKTVVDRGPHGHGPGMFGGPPHAFGGPGFAGGPGFGGPGGPGFGGPEGPHGPGGPGMGPDHGPGMGPDMGHGPGGPEMDPGHGKLPVHTGTIKQVLHGVGGEPNGLLLGDGTIVRLPPPAFGAQGNLFHAGGSIAVEGPAMTDTLGTVVMAFRVGADAGGLKPIFPQSQGGPGKDGHPPGGHGGPHGGPGAPPPG